ncbi:hypothetical protein [Massilia antarctica]|uniref:hypothetical protein n=1 Tax=Massilia antarctica TaxID=2765360 RepID=UPI001E63E70C|nr:hypothetical protein [Massilia antarctica]
MQERTSSPIWTRVGRRAARPICEKLSRSSTSLPARRAESLMLRRKRWRFSGFSLADGSSSRSSQPTSARIASSSGVSP